VVDVARVELAVFDFLDLSSASVRRLKIFGAFPAVRVEGPS
jgi:hypothetical protein